jgi:serine/threonine protein phosphatase 1
MPGRTIAIGDLHGCASHLAALLDALALTPADTLVLLGDYVDRGPDSKNTLNLILQLKQEQPMICLRGNHDLWMVKARDNPGEYAAWLRVGGAQTLGSYGRGGRTGTFDDVPPEHWAFIEDGLVNYHETDSHLFVHAGAEPNTPMAEQEPLWLFWESVHTPIQHASGKTLVVGHTTQKDGVIRDGGSTLWLDTYAYGGGKLSALDVVSYRYWQADMLGRVTTGGLAPRV